MQWAPTHTAALVERVIAKKMRATRKNVKAAAASAPPWSAYHGLLPTAASEGLWKMCAALPPAASGGLRKMHAEPSAASDGLWKMHADLPWAASQGLLPLAASNGLWKMRADLPWAASHGLRATREGAIDRAAARSGGTTRDMQCSAPTPTKRPPLPIRCVRTGTRRPWRTCRCSSS